MARISYVAYTWNLYFCSKYHPWGTPSNMHVPKAEYRDQYIVWTVVELAAPLKTRQA